jgi:hypothetical protein
VTMIASETATLVITQAPPTIGSHPHPQKICPGEPLWLEVSAYGSAANRFQWQRNGTAIPGGTNNGLSILATTTNDSGSYSVVVSNALGVVTSAAAPVEISLLPFILAQSDGEGAGVGATAQFGVIAGGCGPFAYQWQFNGTNIKGATNASLVLTNVQLTDEGLYRVLVGNAHGVVASDAAMLAVSIGAAVNLPEATWSVASGQWLIDGERTLDGVAAVRSRGSQSELAVIVNGPARLRFWLYIAPNTIARFQINGRTQVQWLSELPWTPFEFYIPAGSQVLSWEASGSPFDFNRFVALDQVSLTTNELGPVILSAPQNVAVPAGSNFAFAVTAEGFPPFHYQWQRNGVDLPGANLSVLAVENAQLPHGGDYLVIVSNEFGTATAAAALEVMASAPTISAEVSRSIISGSRKVCR